MPIWIYDRSNPQVSSKCELYLYSGEPTVYPTFKDAPIIGYNPNVYTNFEKVTVDGKVINVKVDFSGVSITNKRFGDAGTVFCPPAGCRNWPYCDAFFTYTTAGDQLSCQGGGCISIQNEFTCIANRNYLTPSGELTYPYRIIDPRIEENAKYWNDVNLWHNGSYTGNVLVENDGPSYENGGYEYIITTGHAITMGPCLNPAYFSFLDPDTNTIIGRYFECPCIAFGSSTPFSANPEANYVQCHGDDEILSDDGNRLWVMVPGQEPIPPSIKRYKVLVGSVPDNFCTYGWHNNHNVTKAIVKNFRGKADRSLPFSYGWGPEALRGTEFSQEVIYGGQGDDGAAAFTVNPDGETIFTNFHGNNHGTATVDQISSINGPGKCNGEFFIKNEEKEKIEVNTWCLPSVYHPELVFSDFPENDPMFITAYPRHLPFSLSVWKRLNDRLSELKKPKIVTYQFPDTLFDTSDEINLPNISDNSEKFPLKEYPFLSRESKNSFYDNSNMIVFEQRKMLQASELNELQEKFYKKEKLLIEFTRHWLSKKYLSSPNSNLLGFSSDNSAFVKIKNTNPTPRENINLIIPLTIDSLELIVYGINNYSIKLNPNWYALHSEYLMANSDPLSGLSSLISTINTNTINFIKITEPILVPLNILGNIVVPATNLSGFAQYFSVGNVLIDVFNLLDCSYYSDLRDNSGGSSLNSPCGAKRNLLLVEGAKTSTIDLNKSSCRPEDFYDDSECVNDPRDYVALPTEPVPHLLFYSVKRSFESNIVDIFLANGVLYKSIEII